MLKDGVTFSNQVISLLVDDKSYSKESSTLSKIYCLLVGSDVQSNDSTCFIIEFSDEIWVVPNNLVETNKLKAWTEDLEQQNKTLVAHIDHLPFSWRKNRFFLGLEAKLATKKIKELEQIKPHLSILRNHSFQGVI